MTTCYDAGALRAYLDGELPEADIPAVAAHLEACGECRARLDELNALDACVGRSFADVASDAPAAGEAFARLRSRLPEVSTRPVAPTAIGRFTRVARSRRASVGSAIAAALLLAVLLVPGVRAAAASLLQVFRAQSVVYVSVSPSRVQQLRSLNVDAHALFISEPKPIGAAPTMQKVDSPRAASALAHFTAGTVTVFPSAPSSTTNSVMGSSAYQLQVNVKTVRQILTALGVTDVKIPDSLGAQPITVSLPASVQAQYSGNGYTATLVQGTSPTVDLPQDVDLSNLGQAVLEVYGMSPTQAHALSKQIDWRSTLVFPFPMGTSQIQQVNVNGAQGVLLDASQAGGGERGARDYVVYWQKGDHFYMLQCQGSAIGETAVLAMADSVK
ncbi:MAG TPA: zf-HC2 domain-containing protein [Ktedonobacterales bacterium]